MPRIVEIIGPSGSGKSTIYDALNEKWTSSDPWVTFDYVKYSQVTPAERLLRRARKAARLIADFLNREVPKTEIISEWQIVDRRNKTFLGDEYAELKAVLMDLVEAHAKKAYDGTDKRFNTIYMLMWSIAQIDTLKRMQNDERHCILRQGEGLISRIMHLNSPTFDESALITYLEAIPLPDVLFALQLHPDEIVKRIMNRNRMSTLHKGMNSEQVYEYTRNTYKQLQRAADFAGKHGVNVYRVDASKPIEQTIRTITNRMSKLSVSGDS